MKRFVIMVKIVLGFIDVSSDFTLGFALLSGQYKLGLHFTSKTKEEYKNVANIDSIGWLVLALPWLAGLARITFLVADQPWRGVPLRRLVKRIAG